MKILAVSSLRTAFPLLAIAVVLPLAKPAVAADIKIVSKVSAPSGRLPGQGEAGMPANQAETVTTYYKGNKVRIERQGGVTVIDGDSGKMYLIDSTRKTYIVRPIAPPAEASQIMGMLDIKTTADIKPNGKTRIIAGKPTTGYIFHATITMGMKAGAMGKAGGGAPPAPKGAPSSMGGFTIAGEEWVTQAVALPGKASSLVGAAQMGNMGRQMPGLKPMVDKLATVKGLPLAVTQTLTPTGMMGAMMGGGGRPPAGGAPPAGGRREIKITNEAVSVSDVSLPATLFSVPSGYKQEQYAGPGMGKPGMRPGMMPPPPPGGGRRP